MYKIIHLYVECVEGTDKHEFNCYIMQIVPCESIWTGVCVKFFIDMIHMWGSIMIVNDNSLVALFLCND